MYANQHFFLVKNFTKMPKKNFKIENFCHNVPNLSEKQSPKFPLKKIKKSEFFSSTFGSDFNLVTLKK